MSSRDKKDIPGALDDYQLQPDGLPYNVMVNPYNMKLCRVVVPLRFQGKVMQLARSLPFSKHGGVSATLVRPWSQCCSFFLWILWCSSRPHRDISTFSQC